MHLTGKMFHENGKLLQILICGILLVSLLFSSFNLQVFGATPKISLKKAVFSPGEDIVISYSGSTYEKDWIGIYSKTKPTPGNGNNSLQYAYAADKEGSVTFPKDNKQTDGAVWPLPAGDYVAYLLENDGYTTLAQVEFSVQGASSQEPPSQDKPKISLKKTLSPTVKTS